MNPFSFKITPILCLEIAWGNSTAAAKRAGKLAVYNQKVSLFRYFFWATAEESMEPSVPIQVSKVCSCTQHEGQRQGKQLTALIPPV